MAKIILGKRPATFVKKVEIPELDGSVVEVTFNFKSRKRTEYGALVDEHASTVRAKGAAAGVDGATESEADAFKLERFVGLNIEADAEFILKIASGWDLDDPFDRTNIMALLDEYGGSGQRIVSAYRVAINEGALGN